MNYVNKYLSKVLQTHVSPDAAVTEYDTLVEYCYKVGVRVDCVEVSLYYSIHHTFVQVFVVIHLSTILTLALFCPTA
jgi:hypothetical protein